MKFGRIALLFGAALVTIGAGPQRSVDLIIRGSTIDTGRDKPFVGDVAIDGDRIVLVHRRVPFTAKRVIDAKDMIVAPGSIDPQVPTPGTCP